MAWQTITTVTQLSSNPITEAGEFQRSALKEKSQNSSHTALQTTTSPRGCAEQGEGPRASRQKQDESKGISSDADVPRYRSAWTQPAFQVPSMGYNSLDTSHGIHLMLPTGSYSIAFAKTCMYKSGYGRKYDILSHRYLWMHRAAFTDPHP